MITDDLFDAIAAADGAALDLNWSLDRLATNLESEVTKSLERYKQVVDLIGTRAGTEHVCAVDLYARLDTYLTFQKVIGGDATLDPDYVELRDTLKPVIHGILGACEEEQEERD